MNTYNWDDIHDAPNFSQCLVGQSIEAKIVSVYDGDSVRAIFPLNDVMYKWSCRLTGIDTPEVRTTNSLEKKFGYFVRNKLRNKILNKVVMLKCGSLDKYGRLLVEIVCDECNVNHWLVSNSFAFPYDGGTKRSWSEYLQNNNNLNH